MTSELTWLFVLSWISLFPLLWNYLKELSIFTHQTYEEEEDTCFLISRGRRF